MIRKFLVRKLTTTRKSTWQQSLFAGNAFEETSELSRQRLLLHSLPQFNLGRLKVIDVVGHFRIWLASCISMSQKKNFGSRQKKFLVDSHFSFLDTDSEYHNFYPAIASVLPQMLTASLGLRRSAADSATMTWWSIRDPFRLLAHGRTITYQARFKTPLRLLLPSAFDVKFGHP